MKSRFFVLFLFLSSFTGCYSPKLALIGDAYILKVLGEENSSSDFVFSKTSSQNIYYCLDKNAISLSNNKSINSIIKKSNTLVLSFGIYDIIPYFDFSRTQIVYQETQIERKLEIMDYYIYQSFELINDLIESKNVYVLKQYNPLIGNFDNKESFDRYIDEVNNLLIKHSNTFNYSFIQVENFNDYLIDDFVINQSIKKEIEMKIGNKKAVR